MIVGDKRINDLADAHGVLAAFVGRNLNEHVELVFDDGTDREVRRTVRIEEAILHIYRLIEGLAEEDATRLRIDR
ncbi:MAG: hypothetical protein M3O36_11335, partial [Myxococcota bacterium]|nr:hypothetical protein [Myxococcota bacterium]